LMLHPIVEAAIRLAHALSRRTLCVTLAPKDMPYSRRTLGLQIKVTLRDVEGSLSIFRDTLSRRTLYAAHYHA